MSVVSGVIIILLLYIIKLRIFKKHSLLYLIDGLYILGGKITDRIKKLVMLFSCFLFM